MSCALPIKGAAQDGTTFLDPPLSETAEQYAQTVEPGNVLIDMRYVDETDRDFFNATQRQTREISGEGVIRSLNGVGIAMVVGLIVLLIFLFLKFGGAGGLLSSDPSDRPRKARGWGLTVGEGDEQDVMSTIRKMTNRREALILLLRHCLLRASLETDVNFKRSDTEREALARLPQSWRPLPKLSFILRETEMVHYGGRDISEESYNTALSEGAAILRAAA